MPEPGSMDAVVEFMSHEASNVVNGNTETDLTEEVPTLGSEEDIYELLHELKEAGITLDRTPEENVEFSKTLRLMSHRIAMEVLGILYMNQDNGYSVFAHENNLPPLDERLATRINEIVKEYIH